MRTYTGITLAWLWLDHHPPAHMWSASFPPSHPVLGSRTLWIPLPALASESVFGISLASVLKAERLATHPPKQCRSHLLLQLRLISPKNIHKAQTSGSSPQCLSLWKNQDLADQCLSRCLLGVTSVILVITRPWSLPQVSSWDSFTGFCTWLAALHGQV